MTDTLSQREVDLVEAAMDLRRIICDCDGSRNEATNVAICISTILAALKAYDPKPEPVPVIPSWLEFVSMQGAPFQHSYAPSGHYVNVGPKPTRVAQEQYEAIRKATAKAPPE